MEPLKIGIPEIIVFWYTRNNCILLYIIFFLFQHVLQDIMEKTVVVSVSVKLKRNATLYMDVLVMSYLG